MLPGEATHCPCCNIEFFVPVRVLPGDWLRCEKCRWRGAVLPWPEPREWADWSVGRCDS